MLSGANVASVVGTNKKEVACSKVRKPRQELGTVAVLWLLKFMKLYFLIV